MTMETAAGDHGKKPAGKTQNKKKDIVKAERTLTDDVMTAAFLIEIAIVFYYVRNDRTQFMFLVGALASVSLVIFLSKQGAYYFGTFLSENILNTRWTLSKNRRPLHKARSMKKFVDQFWQLVIHFSMACTEYYIIFVATKGAPEINYFDNTSLCWFWKGEHTHSLTTQLFYVFQLSIWIVTCFSHRFVEERHKDYYQMYIHHIATIGLVSASWMCGYMRIGILILFLHDASDVPLDTMKILNYLKIEGIRGFFLVEIAFVFNLITWVLFRLYWYPMKAVYSAFYESVVEVGVTPEHFKGVDVFEELRIAWAMPGHLLSNVLLILLQCLHVFWFILLVKIAVKMAVGHDPHSVGEEEYEGQSTDNETGDEEG